MNTIKNILRISTLIFVTTLSVFAVQADQYDLPAVGGYDLISYHQESGPVRGTGFHATQYKGVTYLFANEENKATFLSAPEKFLPAYNGYCAYGLALGQKFNSNPVVYSIIDDTLYLNLNTDIQNEWSADVEGNIRKGDANWESIQKI